VSSLEERIRTALRDAMRSRDAVARAALRSALASIANAGAVPGVPVDSSGSSEHVAGAVAGLGAAEVPRRELSETDVAGIVRTEIAERLAAADQVPAEAADRLRAEAAVLSSLLDG
jgi:hypothetical protein